MGHFWQSRVQGRRGKGENRPAGLIDHEAAAHVIVFGNEKGGSGKTTSAMHVAVHLLKSGFRVATIDLDTRQKSLTRYVQNRLNWSLRHGIELEMPSHFHFETASNDSAREKQQEDFSSFHRAVAEVERDNDFVIVDTPGSDSYLMRLTHSIADTLITPMNDSFVDFDVLGHVDPQTLEVNGTSHYAATVRDARRKRYLTDGGMLDWIVLRNRVSPLASRNQMRLLGCLTELSTTLGFRIVDGIGERVMFREFYPMGLTALDETNEVHRSLPTGITASHNAAREEIRKLVNALRLPTDAAGHHRIEARRAWMGEKADQLPAPETVAG